MEGVQGVGLRAGDPEASPCRPHSATYLVLVASPRPTPLHHHLSLPPPRHTHTQPPKHLVAGLGVHSVLLAVRHHVVLQVHARTRAVDVLLQSGLGALGGGGDEGAGGQEAERDRRGGACEISRRVTQHVTSVRAPTPTQQMSARPQPQPPCPYVSASCCIRACGPAPPRPPPTYISLPTPCPKTHVTSAPQPPPPARCPRPHLEHGLHLHRLAAVDVVHHCMIGEGRGRGAHSCIK